MSVAIEVCWDATYVDVLRDVINGGGVGGPRRPEIGERGWSVALLPPSGKQPGSHNTVDRGRQINLNFLFF